VRGVIITNNGNAQVGSHLKFKEFTTNCQGIQVFLIFTDFYIYLSVDFRDTCGQY
jgi:hypothetical protein